MTTLIVSATEACAFPVEEYLSELSDSGRDTDRVSADSVTDTPSDTSAHDPSSDTAAADTDPADDTGSLDTGSVKIDTGPSCTPPKTLCGATCTDLKSDPKNCGKCGVVCDSGEKCLSSKCGG